jgi:hypothetical protein
LLLDQATAVVAKAERFERIVAKTSGFRQATDAALAAATNSAAREAVLAQAKIDAGAMAAAEGL